MCCHSSMLLAGIQEYKETDAFTTLFIEKHVNQAEPKEDRNPRENNNIAGKNPENSDSVMKKLIPDINSQNRSPDTSHGIKGPNQLLSWFHPLLSFQ